MPLRLVFRAREEVVGQTVGGVAKNDPPSHVSSEGGCGGCAGWCWWAQIPSRFKWRCWWKDPPPRDLSEGGGGGGR